MAVFSPPPLDEEELSLANGVDSDRAIRAAWAASSITEAAGDKPPDGMDKREDGRRGGLAEVGRFDSRVDWRKFSGRRDE